MILSKEMDEWLRELAIRHKEIMTGINGDMSAPDEFLRKFLLLLVEIDRYYKRIQSMFYEFLQNGDKTEYRAAIELLKRIADENREAGKIIEEVKHRWDITSRNVTHTTGRLRLKRFYYIKIFCPTLPQAQDLYHMLGRWYFMGFYRVGCWEWFIGLPL